MATYSISAGNIGSIYGTVASSGTVAQTNSGTLSRIWMVNTAAQNFSDDKVQLSLVDSGPLSTNSPLPPKTLFATDLATIAAWFNEPRPGPSLSPGITASTATKTIQNLPVTYTNGVFLKSCPANATFQLII